MTSFEIGPNRVTWRGSGETLTVEAWGPNSLRVRATRSGTLLDTDFALLPPKPSDAKVDVVGEVARLTNGAITAVLEASDFDDEQAGYREFRCRVSFVDERGRVLLSELDATGALKLRAREFRPLPGDAYRLAARFEATADERFFGMGMYQQETLDLKGATLELAHRNSQASVPFVLSSRGYGLLWHNPAIGQATFGTNRTEWLAESSQQLDYWICAGSTPSDILGAYADATGHAPRMPEYGLGLWQSKLRYWRQDELLDVAREYRRRELPIDVLVADFFHWPKMGDFCFDPEFWPDPAAMVTELRDMGVELAVSVWPQVAFDSENFAEFRRRNLLIQAERGLGAHMSFQGPSMFFDATNPEARAFVWGLCLRNYYGHGVRTFWLDEAEPEYGVYDFDNYRTYAGPNAQVGNLYPQAFSRAFYEGQRAAGQESIVNLVRAAWAGSQRFGALVWSGDIDSTWPALRRQIVAGLNMGVAGIPWFTTDVGGFRGGDVRDPAFHELVVRWFEFATFCPVLRMHGDRLPHSAVAAADGSPRCFTGAGNELWSYGDDVFAILRRFVHVREALRPYLRRILDDASERGLPLLRAMFLEFPDDPHAWGISDQYMFGGDLLVAPVVEPDATRRAVYLPASASWTNLFTGEVMNASGLVEVEAPLGAIPVFARGGASPELLADVRGAWRASGPPT
jgi:alpha-D-xyloside xylohydrolase